MQLRDLGFLGPPPRAGQCGRVGAPCWLAGHQPRCLRRSVLPRAAELPAGTRGLACAVAGEECCFLFALAKLGLVCLALYAPLPVYSPALPSHCALCDCCAQGERFTRGGRGSFLCERSVDGASSERLLFIVSYHRGSVWPGSLLSRIYFVAPSAVAKWASKESPPGQPNEQACGNAGGKKRSQQIVG